jgi:hypothetical protein
LHTGLIGLKHHAVVHAVAGVEATPCRVIRIGKPAAKAARQLRLATLAALMAALMAGLKEKRKLRWPARPLGPLTSFFDANLRQLFHLAHLSQVDCQFGSRPKPFHNNDLQFDPSLLSAHLAHFAHTHRVEEKSAFLADLG